MRIARWWNLTPDQWDEASEEGRLKMAAAYNAEHTISGWEAHLENERIRKEQEKAK